jgi:PIN domain nuclease of toxin-antitoxin system
MLLVQAMGEGLTLMTTDGKLAAYGVPTIGCT